MFGRRSLPRLLDRPVEDFRTLEDVTRVAVLAALDEGVSEDEIYNRHIATAVRTARVTGRDESEVEVVASLARRMVAGILAEVRADPDRPAHHPR